jgi:hypothetical protein
MSLTDSLLMVLVCLNLIFNINLVILLTPKKRVRKPRTKAEKTMKASVPPPEKRFMARDYPEIPMKD